MNDEQLLRQAEQALGEIDRTAGLIDEHAEVLAALRIRIYGAGRKTLEQVLKAAGDIKGKRSLEDLEAPRAAGSLEDAFKLAGTRSEWPKEKPGPKPELTL